MSVFWFLILTRVSHELAQFWQPLHMGSEEHFVGVYLAA